MKKSISELSLVVVTLLGISVISGIVIFFINKGSVFILNYFDSYITNDNVSSTSNKSYININYNNSDKFIYNNEADMLEVLSNNHINTNINNNINVEDNVKNRLYKLTKKKVNDKNSKYNYYKVSDNNYIVGVSSNNKNYYYNYMVHNKLLGRRKYINTGVYNSSDVNNNKVKNNLINSEEDNKFIYDDSYISMASINKNISSDYSVIESIYNDNINNILVLNTYNDDVIVNSGVGFFIDNGIIITTYNFINNSLNKGDSLVALSNNKNYNIDGVITIDKELDIALLKTSDINSTKVKLGSINTNEEIILLGSYSGFGLSGKIGYNLGNGDYQTNSLYATYKNIGSPLFNSKGEVIGIVTSNSIDKDISNSISSNVINKYVSYYSNYSIDDINYYSLSDLSNKYYKYKLNEEENSIDLNNKEWDKYNVIFDLENTIPLKIVKFGTDTSGVSIRYINDTNIDNNAVISNFSDNLIKDNYKVLLDSNKKKVYSNNKYSITLYYEFDYIILIIRDV